MSRTTSAPARAIDAEALHRFFHAGDEETQALRDVSVDVSPGEVVAVVGPSGSGKSTLLSCLAGLDEPDGGTVRIGGVRISREPEAVRAHMRATSIGVMTQNDNLVSHLTVRQNIAVVRRLAALPARDGVSELLDTLGIAGRGDARPDTLSGGESARAALAVALANRPTVLLADEPTGELDATSEQRVVDLLLELATGGTAVLVASHSTAVAAAAHRTIRLDGGRIA